MNKKCEDCIHYDICLQWSIEPLDNAEWCAHFISSCQLKEENEQLRLKLLHLQNSGWSKCSKCVYEAECGFQGGCSKYVKDPPDGGFYG